MSKPENLLAYFIVNFINMLILLLSSNCTELSLDHTWSTVQLFGIWAHLVKDVKALKKVRRSKAKLCHLFRIINDLCDFPDAPVQQRVFAYDSRQANSMQLSNFPARTSQFYHSFFPKTTALWNSLPSCLCSSTSLHSFKYGLTHSI